MGTLSYITFPLAAVASLTGVPALANDRYIDENNIAQCSNSGNGPSHRGELATPLANEFWSRMACAMADEAFDLLEEAPKAPIDMLPNPYPPQESELNTCYYDSFPYPPKYHKISKDPFGETGQELVVSHGFFELSLENFQKIQGAMLWACQPAGV